MKWFFLVLLFFAQLFRASATDAETACAFADKGDWRAAAASYESMVDAHPSDPSLHYNLAVCYDHAGDVGRAVLAYERCLRLSPRASDARHNLALMRDSHSLPAVSTVGKSLPAFTAWLSTAEWQWLSALAAILMIGSSWWCVHRAVHQGRAFPLSLTMVGLFLMLGSIMILHCREGEEKRAVITATDASLLLSPFPSAEVITTCPPGSMLMVEQTQGSFVYGEMLPQGTKGWLPRSAVQLVRF
jgi:hypothetical protein